MDIAVDRTRLAALVNTVTGLRVRDDLPDSVDPPCAVVALRAPVEYDHDFDGHSVAHWLVALYVQRSRQGIAALDGYLSTTGPSSVKAALDADSALEVRSVVAAEYGPVTIGEMDYLTAVLDVETGG